MKIYRNKNFFFILGKHFWKFDPTQKPPVKNTYPKPISNWDGIPDNLDAALHYTNGYTYFFKDENYYRFNDRTFAVSVAYTIGLDLRIEIIFRYLIIMILYFKIRII